MTACGERTPVYVVADNTDEGDVIMWASTSEADALEFARAVDVGGFYSGVSVMKMTPTVDEVWHCRRPFCGFTHRRRVGLAPPQMPPFKMTADGKWEWLVRPGDERP